MDQAPILIAATGAEPVSLGQAKLWLRLETDFIDDDALVATLITAAREQAEDFTGRSFTPGESWQLTLDHFPGVLLNAERADRYDGLDLAGLYQTADLWLQARTARFGIQLGEGPNIAVTSVQYLDATGTKQTLPSNAYTLLNEDGTARLYPVYGTGWPATQLSPGAVTVSFTAGTATPPKRVTVVIQQAVQHWYDNRGLAVLQSIAPQAIPFNGWEVLRPLKVYKL